MKLYRYFLQNFCNPRTGKSFWKWVAMSGLMIGCAWTAFALPLMATIPDITWLGHLTFDGQGNIMLVAYNGLLSFTGKAYIHYFYWIIFGPVFMLLGIFLWNIGDRYKDGYIYVHGGWIKK